MENDINPDYSILGQKLEQYCKKYAIPLDSFFEIINDQKVVPMLRGKGMEYNVFLVLSTILNSAEWVVTKLNLSAQPGLLDEDISITHRNTGTRLIVESKSAVRGSMRTGSRARLHRVPHFHVKSHRSRSFIGRAGNDRYQATDFDIMVTNPSNALFAGGTIGAELELIDDNRLIEVLYEYYGVGSKEELIQAADSDWRFVLPPEIADVQGLIPRTPTVYLQNDPYWLPLAELPRKVEEVVRQRVASRRSRRSSL